MTSQTSTLKSPKFFGFTRQYDFASPTSHARPVSMLLSPGFSPLPHSPARRQSASDVVYMPSPRRSPSLGTVRPVSMIEPLLRSSATSRSQAEDDSDDDLTYSFPSPPQRHSPSFADAANHHSQDSNRMGRSLLRKRSSQLRNLKRAADSLRLHVESTPDSVASANTQSGNIDEWRRELPSESERKLGKASSLTSLRHKTSRQSLASSESKIARRSSIATYKPIARISGKEDQTPRSSRLPSLSSVAYRTARTKMSCPSIADAD